MISQHKVETLVFVFFNKAYLLTEVVCPTQKYFSFLTRGSLMMGESLKNCPSSDTGQTFSIQGPVKAVIAKLKPSDLQAFFFVVEQFGQHFLR